MVTPGTSGIPFSLFPTATFSSSKLPYHFATDRPFSRNVRICPIDEETCSEQQAAYRSPVHLTEVPQLPKHEHLPAANSHLTAPSGTLLMYSHNPSLRHFPSCPFFFPFYGDIKSPAKKIKPLPDVPY